MFGWRRGRSRGCCVVVPVGCLLTAIFVLIFSGMVLAGALVP